MGLTHDTLCADGSDPHNERRKTMKPLNTFKFICNAAEEIANYKNTIRNAEDFDHAKKTANAALGYLNCMITFLNTMIDFENNDFTGDFDEVLNEWYRDIYQAVIDKAVDTKQDHDYIWKLLEKRDQYR